MREYFKKIRLVTFLVMIICGLLFTASCNNTKKDDDDKELVETTGDTELIKEIGGVSETFKGTASIKSYNSSNEAAEAFILEEVFINEEVTIVDIVSNGELSKDEINKLNISEDILSGYKAIEKMEVTYLFEEETEIKSFSKAVNMATNEEQYKITVYIIRYSDSWKYLTSLPKDGDVLSKSYYDSVCNQEKYNNCTLEAVMFEEDYDYETGHINKIKVEENMKIADEKIYFSIRYTLIESNDDDLDLPTGAEFYVEVVDGKNIMHYKNFGDDSNTWEKEGEIEILGLNFLIQSLDEHHINFVKTDFGFKLSLERGVVYYENEYKKIYGDCTVNELEMEYYVSEGVLSGVKSNVDISSSDGRVKVTSVIKCTNYGTTVVERPNIEN